MTDWTGWMTTSRSMTKYDGVKANFDNVEDYLRSLLDSQGTASGSWGSSGARYRL